MSTLRLPTPAWMLPLLQPARYKGAFGGRGSGKSWAFAELMIEAHVADPNTSSVCVREVQGTLRESVKRLLESKIAELGVADLFEIQQSQILRRGGTGKIIFVGMQDHTASSIKSLEGFDRAWVEEAQTLSQKSLDMLRPTIRKDGSELWFSWNPMDESDPVDRLLRGPDKPPDAVVVHVNYSDNPWFPDVLRREMEWDRSRDADKYAHVWLGGYAAASEFRVFRNWRVQDFETPADAVHWYGLDFGFSVDPAAIVRCHAVGRTLYVDHEAWALGVETVDLPQFALQVPDAELWPITADSARPESISHLRKNGLPKVVASVKGPASVVEGIKWLQGYDIVVHPRCRHMADELAGYQYAADPSTGRPTPHLRKGQADHCLDALRYACEAARRLSGAKVKPAAPLPQVSRWSKAR
jgi:phage terminase large subunit